MAKISLMLAEAHSLKEKRMVLRRIKDRVRERLGVVVNEVGSSASKDSWQRSELGVAVVSGDRQKALAVIDDVLRVAMAAGGASITAVARDAITFDPEPAVFSGELLDADPGARAGSGDKAAAGDDWIPDAWREEAGR
jgi:uncharacterized protein YlxP (DUF503 family)